MSEKPTIKATARRIIRLHNHPEAIKQSIKDLKEWAEEEETKELFTDIEELVLWALERLPLLKKESEPCDPPSKV